MLYIGRIEPGKGLRQLMVALELLGGEAPHAVVAGSGSLLAELRCTAWARGLDVEFPGWVADERKRELLATSTTAVLFSQDEACPVFALEALASGLKLVASDVGALPGLMRGGGQILSCRASPQELAHALVGAGEVDVDQVVVARSAYHPSTVGARLADELVAAMEPS